MSAEDAHDDEPVPSRTGDLLSRLRGNLTPPLAAALALTLMAVVLSAISPGRTTTGTCTAAGVASRTMPSVVTIFVTTDTGRSNGSGSFIDDEGHILTNNHVISPAASGGCIIVQCPHGERLTATLVGRDNATDLAVLKVNPATDCTPIRFGGRPARRSPARSPHMGPTRPRTVRSLQGETRRRRRLVPGRTGSCSCGRSP